MGLEADACGPILDRAVHRIIAGGDVRAVRQLLSEAPHSGGAAVDAVKSKLTDPRTIALLVTREPPDMDSLDDLLPSISIDGYDVLLDALTTSDSRTTRRKLLDRIGRADLDIAPLIVALESRHPPRGAGRTPMSDPGGFLNSFAQALAVITLYPHGHPSRERTIDAAYQVLDGLADAGGNPSFTFLEDEVIFGRERLRDFTDWEWGRRLAAAGIQRLEFERRVSRDEFDSFLQEILARLMLSAIDTSDSRQMRPLGIRFGSVGVQGQADGSAAALVSGLAAVDLALDEEVETLRWMHEQVQTHGAIPLLEAEAVVRSLSVAMHGDRRIVLPLLQLKDFDQYTTTHSLNVAVLAMGLAEHLGCGRTEIRDFGVAGLLHDIGKTRIPIEVLTKPGKLTDEERILMNRHPADGARIILQSDDALDLAAVVAYEHHIMLNGGGYPHLHYTRECALASRLVHVCDVFDALRTKRPYRDAWESEKVVGYLRERAGSEFDPALVTAFVEMLQRGETRVGAINDGKP